METPYKPETMPQSKLQHFGESLSKVLKWLLAALLASIFAFIVGFIGWVLSRSTLPPLGGSIWKLVIIPSAVTWGVTMGCLIILDRLCTRRESEHSLNKSRSRRATVISYLVAGLIILLFAAIAVPNFVNARFEWSSVSLTVRVRVMDKQTGNPIQGAAVRVPNMYSEDVLTDTEGWCEAIGHFGATGTFDDAGKEDSGVMHLFGTMRVSAPGYQLWEESFPALFGTRYDYVHGGRVVTQRVAMIRTGHAASEQH